MSDTSSGGNRILLSASVMGLAALLVGWAAGIDALLGPACILWLGALATYCGTHPKLKVFTFTFWVFTMMAAALFYPAAFDTWNGWAFRIRGETSVGWNTVSCPRSTTLEVSTRPTWRGGAIVESFVKASTSRPCRWAVDGRHKSCYSSLDATSSQKRRRRTAPARIGFAFLSQSRQRGSKASRQRSRATQGL